MLIYSLCLMTLSVVILLKQFILAKTLPERLGSLGGLGLTLPMYVWLWTLL